MRQELFSLILWSVYQHGSRFPIKTPNSVLNHVNTKTVPFVKQSHTKQHFSFCVTSYIQMALLRVKGGMAKYPGAVYVYA